MELFYNPERMSEAEIRETFVAHQWLVDEILLILKRQPKGAGVQHIVIVAPRGMGKTTLLLMLRFTLLNQEIAKRWQPVLFPEESYSVYDLADLWVEVLDHLASETGDAALHKEVEMLRTAHPDSDELEALTLARIKDWRVKHKKRLLMLVDNFDMILKQIGDERDNASLRQVLMNDGTMMLIGGSTTFFKEARAYDQPLYNLFKIYDLNGLNSEQIEELLRRRAKLDGVENFEEILRANRTRLRVLEYFTGGNPRLVLMLYRVITQSQIGEVRRGLEKLLDEVTPYYKAKIETLPPQQRKILDQIARISAQTREGLTPTEIASATRLAVNQVSSQLKRLADDGYVRAANIRGRSSYYTLSEPLYAIWHQMRFGRDARTKMNWLVSFLKGWYDAKELGAECQRLQVVFRNYLQAGREKDARDALEHRRYLMEAIEDQSSRIRTFESIILSYLELSDIDTLKREVLIGVDTNSVSEKTRQRLIAAGLLTKTSTAEQATTRSRNSRIASFFKSSLEALRDGDLEKSTEILTKMESQFAEGSAEVFCIRALSAMLRSDVDTCLANLEAALEQRPDLASAWRLKGIALSYHSRFEEAAQAFTRTTELEPDFQGWYHLAHTLYLLGKYEQASTAFGKALQLEPQSYNALFGRSKSLARLSRTDEALISIDMALAVRPDSGEGWYARGELLAATTAAEQALESFDRAIALKPDSYDFMFGKAWYLAELKKQEEALAVIDQLLAHDPNASDAYFLRGLLLISTHFDNGLLNIKKAFDPRSSSHRSVVDTAPGLLIRICLSVITNDLDQVSTDWVAFVRLSKEESQRKTWLNEASDVLQFMASQGHRNLAKRLILESNLEEPLFPLTRALDYLLEQDDGLIEKLSPEVKRIVDEIVDTLSTSPTASVECEARVDLVLSSNSYQRQFAITIYS